MVTMNADKGDTKMKTTKNKTLRLAINLEKQVDDLDARIAATPKASGLRPGLQTQLEALMVQYHQAMQTRGSED